MSGKITEIAGGQIITQTRGDISLYAQNIEFSAGEKVVWTGKENGIFFGDSPQTPPPAVDTEVLEIRINTPLDSGCDWRAGGALRDGLVFGKSYEFEAFRFKNGVVPADNDIRWSYRYDGENGIVESEIEGVRGPKPLLTIIDLDILGRALTIRAYVKSSSAGDALTVWAHYRFRWLSRHQLKTDTGQRTGGHPELIDQGGSSLCGIAVVGYFWCRDQPAAFSDFVWKLHQRGTAVTPGGTIITIDADEHLLQYKMTDARYPMESPLSAQELKQGKTRQRMSPADFIFLTVLKDYMNILFDYEPDGTSPGGVLEGGTGLTLPGEVAWVMQHVASYSTVENDTNLVTSKWSSASNSAAALQALLSSGNKVTLLINADAVVSNNKPLFTIPSHWVSLLGISDNAATEQIALRIYTWGGTRTVHIDYSTFKDGFFGYVAGK